jgi:hypothetical protein
MGRQKVVSREYKLMLRANRFAGDERALQSAARAFWRDLSRSVAEIVVGVGGDLGKVECSRLITFLDTAEAGLHARSYIFRERRDLSDDTREVTLKFRHPDRHIAADRVMNARRGKNVRTKFEEDIKGPFVTLYSFSTTVQAGGRRTFARLDDVAQLFPDLAGRLERLSLDEPISVVKGFTAREVVLGGGELRLAEKAKATAESALIVWYDHGRGDDRPCAVEFSFRYGSKREKYDGTVSRQAFDVFGHLQTTLRAWVDPRSRTKTAFVYE